MLRVGGLRPARARPASPTCASPSAASPGHGLGDDGGRARERAAASSCSCSRAATISRRSRRRRARASRSWAAGARTSRGAPAAGGACRRRDARRARRRRPPRARDLTDARGRRRRHRRRRRPGCSRWRRLRARLASVDVRLGTGRRAALRHAARARGPLVAWLSLGGAGCRAAHRRAPGLLFSLADFVEAAARGERRGAGRACRRSSCGPSRTARSQVGSSSASRCRSRRCSGSDGGSVSRCRRRSTSRTPPRRAAGFLGFQWDNLLLECGVLAAFLPASRRAPVAHFVFRALLFKLYFESGLAKWQSPLGDWQDGSAMTFYYETAPLPTTLAFYAHHLPAWWHHLESRATLVFELVVPFAIFGPRRARLGAAVALTAFQIINAATANYGFFCYLAAALHVFLLDDRDLRRLSRFLLPRATDVDASLPPEAARDVAASRTLERLAAGAGVVTYLGLSLAEAAFAFGRGEPGAVLTAMAPLVERAETLRAVNTYHLFASITRERIEPEFQTLGPNGAGGDEDDAGDDAAWVAHDLRDKPGAPTRAPDFVACRAPASAPRLPALVPRPRLPARPASPTCTCSSSGCAKIADAVAALLPRSAPGAPARRCPRRLLAVPLHDARREARDRRVVAPRAPRRDGPRSLRGHALTTAKDAAPRAAAGPRAALAGSSTVLHGFPRPARLRAGDPVPACPASRVDLGAERFRGDAPRRGLLADAVPVHPRVEAASRIGSGAGPVLLLSIAASAAGDGAARLRALGSPGSSSAPVERHRDRLHRHRAGVHRRRHAGLRPRTARAAWA